MSHKRDTSDLMNKASEIKAPIFAISRLRMGTDGKGVTTLVTFMGCPLKCRYCLNPKCHEPIYEDDGKQLRKGVMMLTPYELYDLVKIDNIYFQATGGGVCFGGGEPTLYADFIEEFKRICNKNWKITLETCLRCSHETIARLSNVVDSWIVDVKSMNPNVYERYTGKLSENTWLLRSLQLLVPQERVTIKVPIIPDFTNESDVDEDITKIKQCYGFSHVVKTTYIIK